MWRREDELARITGKWMQWDLLGGTCCWPDSVYTHFFSLSFFCRMRIEFLSISPFFLSWLVTEFPCRPHSNYRNGPTSLLSPLFFFLLARSPRALSFLVSVASSSFCFFFIVYSPMHQSIRSSFFSSLSLLFSMSPTSQQKKKTRASANAVDERPKRTREQKSRRVTHTYTKKKKRRRKNREKENSFFSIYMSGSVRCLSLENAWGRLFFHLLSR